MTGVTFHPDVDAKVREMAEAMGVSTAEVVRRGLILLDFYTSLPEGEELAVRHTGTDRVERVGFNWDAG